MSDIKIIFDLTAESKLLYHARRAPQPGPWIVEKQGETWAVIDANGCWVCDVGVDELDARHIAKSDPQTIIGAVEKLREMRKALVDVLDIIKVTKPTLTAFLASEVERITEVSKR